MSFLTRDASRRVYYEDYGSGDGALVLLHGWGMSVRVWDHVVPALCASGRRVVLMDHRGCGQSDKDFADMGITAIADDAVALVRELGLRSVVLNGWSLGGAVAVEVAAQLGDACNGLVLTCGATPTYIRRPDFPHGGTEDDLASTLAALTADRVGFLRDLSRAVCAKEVGEDIEHWLWQIFLQASPLVGQTLGQLASLDQREQLAGLTMPILAYVGSADAVVAPPICRWVGDHHPNARVIELEGVGHAPFIEARERYLEELLRFLAEIDPA
jgi:pimeloyl-[acyl-carrier protein] methyl ester esterase